MPLSSPYRAIPWTGRDVADTIRREVEDYRKEVGRRLLDLRKRRGLSQEDAAHAVGVSAKTWGDWERGKRTPYDSNWKKIGEAFKVDPSEIAGRPPSPLGLAPDPDTGQSQLDRIERKLDQLLAGQLQLAGSQAEFEEQLRSMERGLLEQAEARAALRRELLDAIAAASRPAQGETGTGS